jgi:hypothetical protein
MIQIRQHSEGKQLYDMSVFIPFLEKRIHIKQWEIAIEWCSGDNSSEIEKSADVPWFGNHEEFKEFYKGIFQTIDGEFFIVANEGRVRMLAVDSSFWEIESDIQGLESDFITAYGQYKNR